MGLLVLLSNFVHLVFPNNWTDGPLETDNSRYLESLKEMAEKIMLKNDSELIERHSVSLQFVMQQLGRHQELLNTPLFLKKLKTTRCHNHALENITPIKNKYNKL